MTPSHRNYSIVMIIVLHKSVCWRSVWQYNLNLVYFSKFLEHQVNVFLSYIILQVADKNYRRWHIANSVCECMCVTYCRPPLYLFVLFLCESVFVLQTVMRHTHIYYKCYLFLSLLYRCTASLCFVVIVNSIFKFSIHKTWK